MNKLIGEYCGFKEIVKLYNVNNIFVQCGSVCNDYDNCNECPLYEVIDKLAQYELISDCPDSLKFELERLQAENERLTRERDCAIMDIEQYTTCQLCKSSKCYKRNGRESCQFEWRGLQE